MGNPEDHLLREAARKIREANLRQLENNTDMQDEMRGYFRLALFQYRAMVKAGFSRVNASVIIATMIWLALNDNPPQRPPEES